MSVSAMTAEGVLSRGYARPFAGWSAGLRPAFLQGHQGSSADAGRRPALQLCGIRANLSYTRKTSAHSAPPHTGGFEELRKLWNVRQRSAGFVRGEWNHGVQSSRKLCPLNRRIGYWS